MPWSSTPLHSVIHRSNACFQEASSQLWETKAVGRETLNKSASGGLEADHMGWSTWRGRAEHPPEAGTALDLTWHKAATLSWCQIWLLSLPTPWRGGWRLLQIPSTNSCRKTGACWESDTLSKLKFFCQRCLFYQSSFSSLSPMEINFQPTWMQKFLSATIVLNLIPKSQRGKELTVESKLSFLLDLFYSLTTE